MPYTFGLFLPFFLFFMLPMYKSYIAAVKKNIFPETVSMNFVMAGMLPTVAIGKYHFPSSSDPFQIEFWALMSLATIIGFLFAHRINSYLVKEGINVG